ARKFLSLNPRIFHIGGLELGDTMEDMNEHLHFEESKVDIREITGLIPKDAKVVIETKLDLEKQKKEILFLKKIFG
ncbi:MAG: hypothetical protein KKG60_01985, partial [Nanoarchaeota archaeon]|nr:hypothetical protein [Nanoarchaeota archaeon]